MNRCTVIIGLVLAVSALGPVAGSGAARAGEPTVTVVSWHRSGGREYLALRLCVAPAGTDRIRITESTRAGSRRLDFATTTEANACVARNLYWRPSAAAGTRTTIAIQVG